MTDIANNVVTTTATAGLVTVAPSGYTVTFDQPSYNSITGQNVGFTLHGAINGDTYVYNIGTSSFITASGTVNTTTGSEDFTGIDCSTLPTGELIVSILLEDPAGNVGQVKQADATLDTTAPKGYTIKADQALLAPDSAAGFTFAGATTGTTYTYTVSSSGGGSVSSSGTVSSATQNVTPINVSTLSAGTITYSVTLTNTAGNTGKAETATAVLDTAVPSGFTVTPDQPLLTDVAAGSPGTPGSTGFTLAGARLAPRIPIRSPTAAGRRWCSAAEQASRAAAP